VKQTLFAVLEHDPMGAMGLGTRFADEIMPNQHRSVDLDEDLPGQPLFEPAERDIRQEHAVAKTEFASTVRGFDP